MPTHGSLTKAGKVRANPISKLRNKINFVKRFEKRRQPGQRKPERMGRRR
jgi:small subunit ribosomal protein S30e